MSRETPVAGAEDGVHAMVPIYRCAAGSTFPLVARTTRIAKVPTPGPLQEIAANRRHVAQLRRSTKEQGFANDWRPCRDRGIRSEFFHRRQRADADRLTM